MFRPLLISLMIFLLLNTNASLAEDQPQIQASRLIDPSELPATIITLATAYAWFGGVSQWEPLPNIKGRIPPLKILAENIEKFPSGGESPVDIPTRMAFTHLAFIVQNNIPGNISGFVRTDNKTLVESDVPYESILFVTTPIESFGNRVLMILSSVSPETTSIISIDDDLKVELLYDSFQDNKIKGNVKPYISIGSIYGIKVQGPGYFLLQERQVRGGEGFFSPYENRIFAIDVTKGKFELTLEYSSKLPPPGAW